MSLASVIRQVGKELTEELNEARNKDEPMMDFMIRRPDLGIKVAFFNKIQVYIAADEEERFNRRRQIR